MCGQHQIQHGSYIQSMLDTGYDSPSYNQPRYERAEGAMFSWLGSKGGRVGARDNYWFSVGTILVDRKNKYPLQHNERLKVRISIISLDHSPAATAVTVVQQLLPVLFATKDKKIRSIGQLGAYAYLRSANGPGESIRAVSSLKTINPNKFGMLELECFQAVTIGAS